MASFDAKTADRADALIDDLRQAGFLVPVLAEEMELHLKEIVILHVEKAETRGFELSTLAE